MIILFSCKYLLNISFLCFHRVISNYCIRKNHILCLVLFYITIQVDNFGHSLLNYFRIFWIHKLASSVNLYRFTHFFNFAFGSIFKNCLLGQHPQSPLNSICDTGCSFLRNVFVKVNTKNTWTVSMYNPGDFFKILFLNPADKCVHFIKVVIV